MRSIKHAFLNLIRKPSKAVMILVIMVLVFSLVFTGIIIQNSITQSKTFIRSQLGAVVQFEPDWMKAMNDDIGDDEYQKMNLNEATALDIGSDSRVRMTYLNQMAWLNAPGMKSGIKHDGGEDDIAFDFSSSMSSIYNPDKDQGATLNLSGSNNPIPIEFETGKLTLTSGRHISVDELNNAEKVMLVSEEFAVINNLSAGDSIKLKTYESDVGDFRIVGIYSGAAQFTEDNAYTTGNVIKAANSSDSYYMEGFSNIQFVLNDPMDIEGFVSDNTEKLPSKYTKLTAHDNEFKKLTKPLELMEIITSILIWVIFIAGAMIIISIVTIFIRDRKFEIGLLLSSGESKLKITFQYVFEIVLVALLAFAISAGTSQLTARYAGNWIVENQLIEEKTEETGMNDFIFYPGQESTSDIDIEKVAEEFDVSVDIAIILKLFLMSMGLMVIAAGAPLLMILRYKPREALLE